MASSVIKSNQFYKTKTITGSSGAAANVGLAGIPSDAIVVSASTDTGNGYVLIPFKSGGMWYAKVLTWNTWEQVFNTNVTFTVNYY